MSTYVPSPSCKPWPSHPGLYIMETDLSGMEIRVMEILHREQQRRAARRALEVFRPVLPPFWPRRPAHDPNRPLAPLAPPTKVGSPPWTSP